jgi:hypothetical protein
MPYSRIENALDICESHINNLDPTDIKDKELETFIVAGLVILIVSEYEEYLESIFIQRAEECGDTYVSNYIRKTLSQKFRSPDLSKITETLKRFDTTYQQSFSNDITNSPQHAAWDSLLKARHAIVHKKGNLKLTFLELKNNYPLTKQVIQSVQTILEKDTQCDTM